MQLTNEDLLNVERELCSRSLAYFVKRAWHVLEPGNEYIHGWHVDAICEHLEAVHHGDIQRLLINIPPGTMKSTLTSVFFPAWEWGPKGHQYLRYLNAAHEQGLATRDTLKMRRLITSDWFNKLWPIQLANDQNQKTYFENTAAGFRQAAAVNSLTGKRGDRVIWDDPHSVEDAHSLVKLDVATRVLKETLPSRLVKPKESAIIIVMQRLNEKDVSGYILSEGLDYEHLCLPMEYEPKRKFITSIGFEDPRKEEGDLLFPERFPREVVDSDKRTMGSYAAAGQFQQRPTPKGGGIFKSGYWRYYAELPLLKFKKIYADTALKAKEENDYSVFQCWGIGVDNNIYLIDQIRGKWESPELLRKAKDFYNKHREPIKTAVLRGMEIEDKASGTGLIQSLKKESVPYVVNSIPRNIDKVTRAHDAVVYCEMGRVYLPQGQPFTETIEDEAQAFPMGANDDQLDPMMDAIDDLLANGEFDYNEIL